jgi:hypothetical protein
MAKNILFICGSINQTSQMHQIASHLPEYNHYYSPYYVDGWLEPMRRMGMLEFCVAGKKLGDRCLAYLNTHDMPVDYAGTDREYDLVVTCSDLVVQKNIRNRKVVMVQEGMTDPENFLYHLVKTFKLPRYWASTSTTGLSHNYDYFCVASEGYRDLFIHKGVAPEKLRVTGIPNFDNCAEFFDNDFPHHNFVLVATSDARETFKYENRKAFIEECVQIADGRPMIFKLHPNENMERATREINRWAPGALVYTSGNTEHMIANCDVLITKYSSVVYVGLALGKEVYSAFDIKQLRRQQPIQNGGSSAVLVAEVCRRHIEDRQVPGSYDELATRAFGHAPSSVLSLR